MDIILQNETLVSKEEKDEAIRYFTVDFLDKFKDEFEENNGIVTIDFKEPKESKNYYSIVVDNYDDFRNRFNEYKKSLPSYRESPESHQI